MRRWLRWVKAKEVKEVTQKDGRELVMVMVKGRGREKRSLPSKVFCEQPGRDLGERPSRRPRRNNWRV
jgi:hypothetical protein